MGREIREVPAYWVHPKKGKNYIPLFGGSFSEYSARWDKHKKKWDAGLVESFHTKNKWVPKDPEYATMSYEEWDGAKRSKEDYMPEWTKAEKTHIQLYETTTEGTPLTPVYQKDELEKICEYAAKHCSTFGDCIATKEEWMQMLKDDFVHATSGNITFI